MLLSVAQLSVVVASGQFLKSRFQGSLRLLVADIKYNSSRDVRRHNLAFFIANQQLITITFGVLYKCNVENNNNNDK